jgi:hypothetical protein
MTCVKRGNTCLRRIVDLYGDIDLGACVWCSQWSMKCSISLRGKGSGEGAGKRKRSEDGKGKGKAIEEDWDDLAGNGGPDPIGEVSEGEERSAKRVRVQGELKDDKVRGSSEEVPLQVPRKAVPPATVNDLVSSIQELVTVCRDGFAEVREASEKRREVHKEYMDYLKERRELIVEQRELIRRQTENWVEDRRAKRGQGAS